KLSTYCPLISNSISPLKIQSRSTKSSNMIKHLLKIAWRNLIRNKRNSIIIITSLVIAFSFTNLLVSFISYEVNTDSFHDKNDRIYRLLSDDPMGSDRKIRSILIETREYVAQNYSEENMRIEPLFHTYKWINHKKNDY